MLMQRRVLMNNINHENDEYTSSVYPHSLAASEVSTSEVRYTYLPPVIQTLVDDYLDGL
jgi:hypothetical protein